MFLTILTKVINLTYLITQIIFRYVKLQSRIITTRLALDYFTDHSWIMKADHSRDLYLSLSASDKKIFQCDPTTIDWHEYLKDYAWGVQRFLEKKTDI